MSQWFRMYAEVLDDPKVQRLSGDDFKGWVNLLCLTAKHDGVLPNLEDIAFALRIDLKRAQKLVDRLIAAVLIVPEGSAIKPNKWDQRQYKSDVSTDRVKRFRERSKKQPETETETPPESETETELVIDANASIGDVAKIDEGSEAENLKPQHFVEAWNDLAGRLGKPRIRDLTPERRQKLKARINGHTIEDFQEVLGNIERSPFLRGDKGWHGLSFDWVLGKSNFQKILEGNYNS